MREILFRGKRIDNGEWVYGFLYETTKSSTYNAESFILEKEGLTINYRDSKGVTTYVEFIQVDPLTVGQYTGLTDKNGKKIFEGDIVRENIFFGKSKPVVGAIQWDDELAMWIVAVNSEIYVYSYERLMDLCYPRIEIIGNIHDNLELLKGDNND